MARSLVEISSELVKAHLAQSSMAATDIPEFLKSIYSALRSLRDDELARTPFTGNITAVRNDLYPRVNEGDLAPVADLRNQPGAGSPIPVEAEASHGTDAQHAPSAEKNLIPTIRQTDISDPVFEGLDPWLAQRISQNVARKLDANNKIHATVFDEYIVCLEDGKEVTLLRAYLRGRFGLSLHQYAEKWNLPDDYPSAPPAYVARKRQNAIARGLGVTTRAYRERPKEASAPTVKRPRGRPRKNPLP